MYIIGENKLSDAEAKAFAEEFGSDLSSIAAANNWEFVEDEDMDPPKEGKPNGSTETTPPMGPVMNTAGGDSISADTSLEQSKVSRPIITVEDLNENEGKATSGLMEKLSAYGIRATEAVAGIDGITLSKVEDSASLGDRAINAFAEFMGAEMKGLTVQTGVGYGNTLKSKEDLQLIADQMNQYVEEFGNASFVKEESSRLKGMSQEYDDATKAEEYTPEQISTGAVASKAERFEDISNGLKVEKFGAKEENFSSKEEFEEYKKWDETGVIPELTDKQKENWDLERKRSYADNEGKRFSQDLNAVDRFGLLAIKSNEQKLAIETAEDLRKSYEGFNEQMSSLNKDVESFNDQPNRTQAQLNDLQARATNIMAEGRKLDANRSKLSDTLSNAPQALNNLNKDYNLIAQLGTGFKDVAVNSAYYVEKVALQRIIGLEIGAIVADQNFKATLQDSAATSANYGKSGEGIRDLTDAMRWAASTAVQAIPSLSLAATGPAALPLFFLTGAGSKAVEHAQGRYNASDRLNKNVKYLEDNPDISVEERTSIESEIQKDADTLNVPEWKNMTSEMASGIFEVAFEGLGTLNILKGLGDVARALPKEGLRKASRAAVDLLAKNSAIEGATEGLTELSNNIMDINLMGEDKNYFEGVGEAFAGGALIGLGLSVTTAGGMISESVSSSLSTKAELKELRANADAIGKLLGIEGVTNPNSPDLIPPGTNPEVVKLVEEIQLGSKALKEEILSRIGVDLTADNLYDIGAIDQKMRKIESDMNGVIESGVTGNQLAAVKNELKSRYDKLSQEKQDILSPEDGGESNRKKNAAEVVQFDSTQAYENYTEAQQTAQDAALLRRYNTQGEVSKQEGLQEARKQLKEEGSEPTAEQIKEKAAANFIENDTKTRLAKGKVNVEAFIKASGLDIKIDTYQTNEETKAAIEKSPMKPKDKKRALAALKKGEFVAVEDGAGNIIVNELSAVEKGMVGVYSHEVLHTVLNNKFKDDGAQSKAGQEFLENLKNSDPAIYDRVIKAIEPYKDSPDYFIESMNALSDILSDGVRLEDSVLDQIRTFINKVIAFSGIQIPAQDTLNFIKDYNRAAQFGVGKVTKAARNQTESGAKLSKATVLESINALVPANVKTKAEFQNRKVFNAVYAATEPGGAISNYVRSKSESKEVADKAMESVVDRLINYDPAAVRKKANGDPITFGEFIFANTNFGKLDARKSLAIEAKETARKISIDSEQAKEIADKDTAADPRDTGKPKRMNLVTRGVISAEAISKAQETVKRAIGALKVPFNKKTSLNVTVKPYIAALKKGFAEKELVKAVAQDMGNGGDLKSWMRKHKAAILDNMTTTYLIGAFPAAIQKQVKGTDTWTSDWAGKEIQREKTTTANAGRTSGAFMVRRLPNAASKISDAEFMGMLFDDKGVIKPGKKPSLAKAIAEEVGFDIMTAEIQNPDGQIAEAFKDNQEALGVVLFDNYIAEARKDAERGSAKFSISDKYAQSAGKLLREAQQDLDGTIDEQGNILVNPEKYAEHKDIGLFVRTAFDEGIVSEVAVLRFLQNIKSNENISQEVKGEVAKALSAKRSSTETLTEFADDMSVVAEALGTDIMDVISYDGLGFINRVLDAAASKLDKTTKKIIPGATGNFFKYLKNLKGKVKKGVPLPPGLDLSKVKPMNSKIGVMAKIARILNKDISAAKKKELYEELIPEIEAANIHNKLLAKHIITQLVNLAKTGKISKASLINMLQLQTQATKGLRSLTGLKYITFKDRSQGNIKGEHLADNAGSMLEIVDLAFEELTDAELSAKIDGILEYHDQWLENKETLKLVDVFGANNPFKDLRIRSLSKSDRLDVFTYNLKPAETLIKAREDAIRTLTKTIPPARRAESAKRTEQDIASNKASAKFSVAQETDMSKTINDMIERNKGVQSEKVFSAVQAKKRGKTIGKYNFLSPAADDFRGLTSYTFAGKGKQGEADQKFFEEKMIRPYQRGINAIDVAKQTIKNDFTAVVKAFAPQAKIMRNKIPGSDYTYDQAIRVYMWTRQGTEVPGMSKRDLALLNKTVAEDPAMIAFADAMLLVSKQGEWMAPGEHWLTNTVLSDLNNMSEKIGRKIYLEEFLAAKDIIFSPENLAKIEAVYGSKYVSALKDILYRMENGTNRPSGDDATTNRWLNWINQSTGAIMFFNRRSAVLQLLSTVNFINWSDNNPVKAAMAFANQKQFWGDFAMLFNSPKLKQRRAGLRTDVSQAEIANAVAGQTNKAAAVLNYLLKIGFTPTQIADSFAVASGGAAFYRNRVNTYLKQGMSQKEAETLAFEEFSSTADEAQQSSDPMLISQQQASMLGRLVLSFQNTTMQYSRLMKKATLDLVNGRGDPKTNISKIIYYGAVQNFIFSSLQSALFAVIPGFGSDDEGDEEVLDKKGIRILNSMFDSLLKGTGLTGAVIATIKNVIQEYAKQEEKNYNSDHIYTFLRVMSIMPAIGSKLSKLYKAQQTKRFEKYALEARPFGVVADGRVNLGPGYRIVGNLAAATVNLPLDRVVDEVSSLAEALDNRNSQWQRLALALGWKTWDVGAKNEENDLLKIEGKKKRKIDSKAKSAATRAKKKDSAVIKDVSDF